MSYPTSSNYKLFELAKFKGMNCDDAPNRIDDAEATYMNNFWVTDNGTLSKRPGFNKFKDTSGLVLSMINFNNKLFYAEVLQTTNMIVVYYYDTTMHSTYFSDDIDGAAYENYNTVNFAIFNNMLILFTGRDIYEYDNNSSTFTPISENAYIPTVMMNVNKDGAGDTYEQFNVISYKYKMYLSTDGESTMFVVPFVGGKLTSTDIVSCKVNGEDYTVHYISIYGDGNSITSSIQIRKLKDGSTTEYEPYPAGTNNIELVLQFTDRYKQYSTITKKRNAVLSNYIYTTYGGENDTRLIVGGNDATIYRSSVMDIHYFPENYFQIIGRSDEKVTGFAIQYDYCIVFKENSLWLMNVDELMDGQVSYPIKPLNADIGCMNYKSIQYVENKPYFINKYKGVMSVVATQLRDERDVQPISDKINPLLLADIKTASYISSCDWGNKYFIALDKKIYIYDYKNAIWYFWTMPVNIATIYNYNDELFIGTQGVISKLDLTIPYDKVDSEETENSIECEWRSKLYDFDAPQFLKLIKDMYVNIKSADRTSVDFYYTDEVNPSIINTTYNYLATYTYFDYSKFSYLADDYKPHAERQKVKVKKVVYFQLIAKNSEKEETLDIYNISLRYKLQKYVK